MLRYYLQSAIKIHEVVLTQNVAQSNLHLTNLRKFLDFGGYQVASSLLCRKTHFLLEPDAVPGHDDPHFNQIHLIVTYLLHLLLYEIYLLKKSGEEWEVGNTRGILNIDTTLILNSMYCLVCNWYILSI